MFQGFSESTSWSCGSSRQFGVERGYDCETGDERELTVTAAVLKKYEQVYKQYLLEIERFCSSHTVPSIRADISMPFDELVLRVFRRGGFLR